MIQDVLNQIGGIEAYGVISIGLFFLFFLGMLVWAFRLKRPFLKTMSTLPLDPDADESPTPKHTHE